MRICGRSAGDRDVIPVSVMRSRGFDVLAWSHRFLPSPTNPREPLVLSDDQARFVIGFYELDDGSGYVYRRGCLQAPKGWGKSPLGAVLALAEFAGPVAPAIPWVQVAACSEGQAVSNVYSLIWSMLSENEAKAARELGVDLGRGRLYLKANPGAKLEAVSSAWGTREGQRVTFAVLDETHNFLKSNGGHRLARVLRRNAAKTDGRTLELANAHELGEESTCEETLIHFEDGRPGILVEAVRPSREPDPDLDDDTLRGLLAEVYSGAPWVDLDRLVREIRDPGVPWPETARFFFNLPSGGTLAAVDPRAWSELARERVLHDGEALALGFDGSHSGVGGGTALIGCTADFWLFPVEILERPANAGDEWRVDRQRVHRAIEYMIGKYDVQLVYADPWTWQSELETWSERWPGKILEVPTNSTRRMTGLVDRFRSSIAERRVSHDGDPDLARHVLNARLRKAGSDPDGRGAYVLERAGPGRWIDGCVASVLAVEAAAQLTPEREPMIAFA
jgi:Terminase large subunit, endonuclease domain